MMLDPAEVAAYEEWKQHKLTTATDISASAFNAEQEGPALAWEAGVRVGFSIDAEGKTLAELIESNPYRGKGMSGERPIKPKRVTS